MRNATAQRLAVPGASGLVQRVSTGDAPSLRETERNWFNFELGRPHLHASACRSISDRRPQCAPEIVQRCGDGTRGGWRFPVRQRWPPEPHRQHVVAECWGFWPAWTGFLLPCRRCRLPSHRLLPWPNRSHLPPGSVVSRFTQAIRRHIGCMATNRHLQLSALSRKYIVLIESCRCPRDLELPTTPEEIGGPKVQVADARFDAGCCKSRGAAQIGGVRRSTQTLTKLGSTCHA